MDRLRPDDALASRTVEEHMRLFHEAVYQGAGFPHDAVLPMSYGDKRDWSYHPRWDDVQSQIDFALRHDSEPVYRVAVAMPASLPPTSHGGKGDVIAASALWADIDDSRGVHGAQELPLPSPEQAWEILRQYPLPPTGVMDTGGGLLAFWRVETFSPGPDAGQRLRQAHLRALEVLHERLAVSFDPAVPMNAAPVTRCPAGVNGKTRPVPGNEWSEERVALIRPDITTAPVRLVWLRPGEIYGGNDLIAALDAAGLLEPKATPRAPTERYHVCGGTSPEERICVELPMARICREMSFVGPDGELIEWGDREDIPDDADDWSLTWSHERSKTYAKLYYEPPAGHEDMPPVSALTCWGTGTAGVFGATANTGKTCTWKWLRRGYFRDARVARNFVRRYAGRPDDAIATLVRYPRPTDLLAAQATLSTPVVVASTVPSTSADVRAEKVAVRNHASLPWKKRHTLTYAAGDITEWYGAHPAKYYGVALDGARLVVATAAEQLSVPLIDQAVDELDENTARGMRLYAYDALRVAREVALKTGRGVSVRSIGAGARALGDTDEHNAGLNGAREAIAAALMAEVLSQRGDWPVTAAKLDELWRPLAVDGIPVDIGMLQKAVERADGNQNKAAELLRAARHDGRVRPIVKVYGTATGRMTIEGPALQNLNRDLKPALLADHGKALVGLDLHQVEPRVAAVLSGDEAMRRAVAADVYVAAAQLIWPDRTVDRELRAKAKTVLISLLYGEGPTRLAADLGIEQQEAKELIRALLSGWPRFRAWRDDVIAQAKAGQARMTIAGRPLPRLDAGEEYKAVNHLVQGSAADIFVRMILQVAQALPAGARLWLAVHDELVVECRADDVDAVKQLLTKKMTLRTNGVTVNGDSVVYGERWGA